MRIARNIIAGALSGIGVVVLLQQYAVLYPTGTIAIIGIAVGIAVQFGVASLFGRPAAQPAYATTSTPAYEASDVGQYPTDGAAYQSEVVEYPNAEGWFPTHRVPEEGLTTWAEPDPDLEVGPRLDAHLAVNVDETRGEWAHVVCENGWSAWVPAARLEAWQ